MGMVQSRMAKMGSGGSMEDSSSENTNSNQTSLSSLR